MFSSEMDDANHKIMEDNLKEMLWDNNLMYIKINDTESFIKIYEIFKYDRIYEPKTALENLYIGWYYLFFKKNKKRGKEYIKYAINEGYIEGITSIGYYYSKSKKYDKALDYYHKAINMNCPIAMNNLGKYYYDCLIKLQNIDSDDERIEEYKTLCKKYLIISADQFDNVAAMNNLGHYYFKIENNDDLAFKYFLRAVEKGCKYGMNSMGSYYTKLWKDSIHSSNIDERKKQKMYKNLMKKYFKMAIDKGNLIAMFNLGVSYSYVKKYDKMKKYFEMAINKNEYNAMTAYGKYYNRIEFNHEEAKKLYLMAIEYNDSKAMFELGYLYQYICYDYKLCEKYYLMAINYENKDAMYYLGRHYRSVNGNFKKYYLMACKHKCPDAFDNLLTYYENYINSNIYDKYFFEFINLYYFKNEPKICGILIIFDMISLLHQKKLNEMKLHFYYSPSNEQNLGYELAKEHFYKNL